MVIALEPLRVAMSDRTWRGLPLMEHQARALDLADEPAVLIEAPTGAGKTWAGAAPLVDRADLGEGALFAYPTNALADDQLGSLAALIRAAGRRAGIVRGGSLLERDADIILWRIHSAEIDEAAGAVGGRSAGRTLARVLERLPAKPLWIVTNPDSLYLLCTARYALSPQLWSRLGACSSLVLDEFHLYRGPTLVRALVLTQLLRLLLGAARVRVLTATLAEHVRDLLVGRLAFASVSAPPAKEGRVVQHPVNLTVVTATGDNATTWITQTASALRSKLRTEQAPDSVPLLVLRQSVFATMALEDQLVTAGFDRPEIGIYRGLTSKAIRSVDGKTIVVGTSTLEVGVDFKTTRLFFEALSSQAFAQRLGRVGRHSAGTATFLTDARVASGLTGLGHGVHPRESLFSTVSRLLPLDNDLQGFVTSEYGRCVVDAAFEALETRGRELRAPDVFFQKVDSARLAFVTRVGMAAPPSSDRISRAARRRLAAAISFRGGAGSVEVFDRRERQRRGADDLAHYDIELPQFYRRAEWVGSPKPGACPIIVGFRKPRSLALSLRMATAVQTGIHAPEPEQIELRVDGSATAWDLFLRERAHIVGLFPRTLRDRISWREDVFDSDDNRIALLDDDALVGAFLWERS